MKKFFAVAAVAGMAVLASCGNAEDLAQKMQDSIDQADSIKGVMDQMMKDSTDDADSIADADAKAKAAADSAMMKAHQDSVDKGLIKEPKK